MTHAGDEIDDALLAQWLGGRDADCPVCSYNLRGLTTPVCPECAAPLRLAVASDNQNPGAWALAVVSFALALGFDAVVAVLMTTMWILHPPPATGRSAAIALLASFVTLTSLSAAGVVTLYALRRRWMRRPRRLQWRVAWTIFAIVGAFHALFGLFVGSRL